MTWNSLRYTLWAPWYDALVAAVGFQNARRESIERLHLAAGQRVLIVGAGTGLDLELLPHGVNVTAIDITEAMLDRLRGRAERLKLDVQVHIMDARRLDFADQTFDAVVMHLILAVMPEPALGLREAERVLVPGGRIAVFDKFLRDQQRASLLRRLGNLVIKPLFTDLNRRFGPLVAQTRLEVEHDTPVAFGGMFRVVTLVKPRS
jgi:ubiquinone/menaquinone biosynthesis C-methylase UbiE